jgi:hypothetical protein
MPREWDGHYEASGLVSVWIGTFPDEASYERYFKEDWEHLDADEFPTCLFWNDLGIRWFDHDFQEGWFVGSLVPVTDLLGKGGSYLTSFRHAVLARCVEVGLCTANSAMLLYDFDYPEGAGYSSPHMTFVGTFPYRKSDA